MTDGKNARVSERKSDASGRRESLPKTVPPLSTAESVQAMLGSHEFNRLRHTRACQARLAVSDPTDPYEREAERVADEVMRMPEPGATAATAAVRSQALQRCCAGKGQWQAAEEDAALPIARQGEVAMPDSDTMPTESYLGTLAGRGSPLPESVRNFMEPRFGADFGAVRVHTDAAASRSAESLHAVAYTTGRHIVFRAGNYDPESERGRRLLAHELTHVVQQNPREAHSAPESVEGRQSVARLAAGARPNTGAAALIQRTPETWLRGEAVGVGPARPGSVIHDFGDGLYLTNDPAVANQYAALRAGTDPSSGRVMSATFERPLLGRMLDLTRDPRWAEFMQTRIGTTTYEQLIRMANENYWSFFQEFLRHNGLTLESFDAVIGPEYVRGGTQVCIRNPAIAEQVRGMLSPVGAAAPVEGPTEFRVGSRFRVAQVEPIPGGRVVSHLEVTLGEGLEQVNAAIAAKGGRPIPATFTLRVTTDPSGALIAADTSVAEASALAESLARQALASAPRTAAAAEGAGAGAAAAAGRVSPWVRGASWAGLAIFLAITAYRYREASAEDRPRVLARAGGGFAGGMAAGYVVCNLVLGIETLGWSLVICAGLAGIPGGIAGEAAADVVYDEATIDDEEIRAWVGSRPLETVAGLPSGEKLRLIFSLMRGWISDEDVVAMERILASVRTQGEMDALERALRPHLLEMSDLGQRTRVRVALARHP